MNSVKQSVLLAKWLVPKSSPYIKGSVHRAQGKLQVNETFQKEPALHPAAWRAISLSFLPGKDCLLQVAEDALIITNHFMELEMM